MFNPFNYKPSLIMKKLLCVIGHLETGLEKGKIYTYRNSGVIFGVKWTSIYEVNNTPGRIGFCSERFKEIDYSFIDKIEYELKKQLT